MLLLCLLNLLDVNGIQTLLNKLLLEVETLKYGIVHAGRIIRLWSGHHIYLVNCINWLCLCLFKLSIPLLLLKVRNTSFLDQSCRNLVLLWYLHGFRCLIVFHA